MIKAIQTTVKKGIGLLKPGTRTAKKAKVKKKIEKLSHSDHEHGFLGDPNRLFL